MDELVREQVTFGHGRFRTLEGQDGARARASPSNRAHSSRFGLDLSCFTPNRIISGPVANTVGNAMRPA